MALLRVFLFQTLRVETGEGHPLDLGSPTTRSLFAYLLLNRAQPSDRRRLAFLFWPRGTESAARRNLRQYLHRIRRALEPVEFQGDLILTSGSTVQINPQAEIWLDLDDFRRGLRSDASLEELENAVSLYAGDLLEDIYEDWCHEEREAMRRGFIAALERLSQAMEAANRIGQAIGYAETRAVADPLDEEAHYQLMRLYVLNGSRNRALQHFQEFRKTLAEELNAIPQPELQALFKAIQDGTFRPDQSLPILPAPVRLPPVKPPALPLVGRQSELDRLEAARQQAIAGEGGFWLITGESGIGKTRLVQEFLGPSAGTPVLQGVCHELESLVPFASLRQAIQKSLNDMPEIPLPPPTWMGSIIPLLPALAQRYPYLQTSSAANDDTAFVLEAFVNLILGFASQSQGAPLHLVLDNLQWADSLTWQFLTRLAQYVADSPLLVIGLCRLEDLPQEQHRLIRTMERNDLLQQIPLRRLSEQETTALVRLIHPDTPDDSMLSQRVYQETEGNPFFIIETVRAMQEAGRLPVLSGERQRYPLPEGIQRVIEARLDHLAPVSQELLGAAAAIGRDFTFSMLVQITGKPEEEIVGCIEEWVQRGLVREIPQGYDFSHDRIRQVAYAGLSRARRQFMHRRIATVLADVVPRLDASTLAHHYARSDQPLKALPYLTEAGEQALRVRSYHEARQFGLQAVSLLGRMPGPHQRTERIDLNLQLAQVYAFTGDLGRAREIMRETEHLAYNLNDDTRLGKIYRQMAQIHWLRGAPGQAADYARRTLRAAEEISDENLYYAALRMLGRVSIALAAFDDAIAYLREYTQPPGQAGPPPSLPIVYGYLGVAYARVGSWQRSLDAAERGVQLAEADGTAQTTAFARMQQAFIYGERRDWGKCLEVLQAAPVPSLEEENLSPLGFMLLSLQGIARAHTADPQQGAAAIQVALRWAERVGYRVFNYLPRLFLTESYLLAGDLETAMKEAGTALKQAREVGNPWAVGVGLRLTAEIRTRFANPNWRQVERNLIEARNLFRQVRARPDLARTYLALRRLYDRAGQVAWAVDCHFRAITIYDELEMVDELRRAQGQAAGDRKGAVVIPGLELVGPNLGL